MSLLVQTCTILVVTGASIVGLCRQPEAGRQRLIFHLSLPILPPPSPLSSAITPPVSALVSIFVAVRMASIFREKLTARRARYSYFPLNIRRPVNHDDCVARRQDLAERGFTESDMDFF